MEVDAREAVLGPKGLQKKRLFGDGGGSGEACPKGGCVKKTEQKQKSEAKPQKARKKRNALQLAGLTLFWGVSARLG